MSARAYADRLVVVGPSTDASMPPVTWLRTFERDLRHYVSLLERKPSALRNGEPFKTMHEESPSTIYQ